MPAGVARGRGRHPAVAALLGVAALANLAFAFRLMRDGAPGPWYVVVPVLLITALQAWSSSQALEGRRLWLAWSAIPLTLAQWAAWPLLGGLGGMASALLALASLGAAAALPFLLTRRDGSEKARSTTH